MNGKAVFSKLANIINMNNVYEYYNQYWNTSGGYDVESLYRLLQIPEEVYYTDYLQKYERQDIVSRIVKTPVMGSWRHDPSIYDVKGEDSAFNMALQNLEKDTKLYAYLTKLDLLATLGRYSVLFLGLNDGKDPSIPVTRATKVLYLAPIPENRAEIQTWEDDITSPRYGMPTSYSITINTEVTASVSQTVDHTRVIHVAENTIDSDVYGVPYLKPIFNNLIGLDILSLSSPVMYKSGARPGYIAQPDETQQEFSEFDIEDAKAQIAENESKPGLNRWMLLEGIKVTPLPIQVVSPMEHVQVQLKLISAATRIPLRMLTGSERGELASTQDVTSWLSYLEERRLNVAERLILKPTIDKFIEFGVLPEPKGGEYTVEWPPLIIKSDKEQVEISLLKAQTVKTRNEAIGGEEDYPNDQMYGDWGKSEEEIEGMAEEIKGLEQEEQNDYDKAVYTDTNTGENQRFSEEDSGTLQGK
jgi:hypothetical protein